MSQSTQTQDAPGRRHRALVAAAVAAATVLLAAACTDSGDPPELAGPGEVAIGLRTDLSCEELLEAAEADLAGFAVQNRMAAATDEMLSDRSTAMDADAAESAEAGIAAAPAAGGDDSGGTGEVVAGTNIAESGVDEGDILKTDGSRIVALSGTTLRVVGLDGTPAVDGTLVLPGDVSQFGEMFLRGDEVVLMIPVWGDGDLPVGLPDPETPTGDEGAEPGPSTGPDAQSSSPTADTDVVPFRQGTRILRVDISDVSSPQLVEQSVVEGDLVASRMVDGTIRAVVRSPMAYAEQMWSVVDADDAEEAMEGITAEDLLPRASEGGEVRTLGDCSDMAVVPPAQRPTGTDIGWQSVAYAPEPNTVTVLTIGESLADMAPVSVSGMADIVYASVDSLYVTNTGWSGEGPHTFVHRFDTTGADPATYTGSGLVPGTPLNQYSLSAEGDQLRIVTTTEDPVAFEDEVIEVPAVDPPDGGIPIDELPGIGDEPVEELTEPREWVPPTEGRLTVLEPASDGTLTEIGSVDDLGIGERVQSVRFIGDMAYVVTFRQTDPLYAIDLSDPTDPTALGELKITGFSEYLHPIGDGLLLGIGREATEEGFDTGFKASVFDVTDPTNPTEIHKWVVPNAWSEVGSDPHSFTWDPVAGHAIFPLREEGPVTIADCPPGAGCVEILPTEPIPTKPIPTEPVPGGPRPATPEAPASSAVVLAAGADGLTEVARLSHSSGSVDEWLEQIRRSVVIDRDLWTMSHTGLGLTDADQPGDPALVAF